MGLYPVDFKYIRMCACLYLHLHLFRPLSLLLIDDTNTSHTHSCMLSTHPHKHTYICPCLDLFALQAFKVWYNMFICSIYSIIIGLLLFALWVKWILLPCFCLLGVITHTRMHIDAHTHTVHMIIQSIRGGGKIIVSQELQFICTHKRCIVTWI